MAGKIVADTLEHSTAGSVDTQYVVNGSAKAWATFGTNATIDDSLNASSATDNGTADFSLTAANATATANTAVSGSIIGTTVGAYACMLTGSGVAKTTTVTRFKTVNYNDGVAYIDIGPMQLIIHGDLA